MAEVYPIVERVLVASVVIGAVVYLALHWSGALARWRARKKPDVKVSSLVRRSKEAPPPDDCCR